MKKRMKRFLTPGLLALACLSFCAGGEAATVVNDFATLRDAVQNPASLDIELGADITLTAAIPVSLDAKIDGKGFTLKAGGNFRHFNVTGVPKPEFKAVTFDGDAKGGGVDIGGGEAKFENVVFTNNSSDIGGAVSVASGAAADFTGGAFRGNKGRQGGAVHTKGTAAFKGSPAFTENSGVEGGALYVAEGGSAAFTSPMADGQIFRSNRVSGKGGAVYAAGRLNFSGKVTFTENSAISGGNDESETGQGGALYVAASANMTFASRTSRGARSEQKNEGPTLRALSLPIYQLLFDSNGAGDGGAIYLATRTSLDLSQTVLFKRNSVQNYGGAIYASSGATITYGTNVKFEENRANDDNGYYGHGGAIYAADPGAIPTGATSSDFDGNSALHTTQPTGGHGGAIYLDSGKLTLPDTFTFENNKASNSGGAVYANGDVDAGAGFPAPNTAGVNGGAICSGGNITATKVTFKGQKAANNGGATWSGGSTTLTDCLLDENTAGNLGGASTGGSITARQTTFSNNIASNAGGAVYLTAGGTSSFTDCAFSKNQANSAGGGALFLTGNQHELTVTTCAFEGNHAAGGEGGALRAQGKKLTLFRSTFKDNDIASSAAAKGGAVHISTTDVFHVANCTFHGNEAGQGAGGALYIDAGAGSGAGTTDKSALLYSTFAQNLAGGGQGGGIWTACDALYLMGVLSVGNTASFGADIFSGGGKIQSQGYNILADYGEQVSGAPANGVLWTAAGMVTPGTNDSQSASNTYVLFFGSNVPANNPPSTPMIGSTLGTQTPLLTLALTPTTSSVTNPALDAIPQQFALNTFNTYFSGFPHTDERGVSRPDGSQCDIGAYESASGVTPPQPGGNIAYIKMGGIPNTHVAVGQTTCLAAYAYDPNGQVIPNEPVTWSSSNPSVARIDNFGNLYARSVGKTVISVTTVRPSATGKPATDSAPLEVREEMSYTNVHPEIWKMLGEFNDLLGAQGAGLTFADSNPAKVKAATFRNTFREAWGLSSEQVTALKNRSAIRFGQKTLPSSQGWSASKPAIEVALSGRTQGDILPLKYRWSLSWEELSTLRGRKVTQVKNAQELSSVLKLAFVPANGAAYDVVGGEGVSAADAESKGALRVANGNNGLTLELIAFVADAAGPTASSIKGKPQLIDGLLVIPDGTADGTISGVLGLLQRPASNGGGGSGSKGEGGGGGCDAGVSGMMLALVVAFLLRRKA